MQLHSRFGLLALFCISLKRLEHISDHSHISSICIWTAGVAVSCNAQSLYFGSMMRITRITPCWAGKFCLRNPELVEFRLWNMEFWVLESGVQLKESGIPQTIGIRNPSSSFLEKWGIQYWNLEIHSVESRIQDRLRFPFMGWLENLNSKSTLKSTSKSISKS